MDEGDEAPEEKDWDAACFSAGIRRNRIEPTKNLEWWLVTGIPILSGIFSLVNYSEIHFILPREMDLGI